MTDRKTSEEGLKKQTERLRLLWEAASVLLTTDEPDTMMRALFERIAGHFGLDAYFNFMVDESGEFLRLESCVGVPREAAESIRRLEFGQAVCGQSRQCWEPITATGIRGSNDPRVQLGGRVRGQRLCLQPPDRRRSPTRLCRSPAGRGTRSRPTSWSFCGRSAIT